MYFVYMIISFSLFDPFFLVGITVIMVAWQAAYQETCVLIQDRYRWIQVHVVDNKKQHCLVFEYVNITGHSASYMHIVVLTKGDIEVSYVVGNKSSRCDFTVILLTFYNQTEYKN